MKEIVIIALIAGMAILAMRIPKLISRILNRRLARKLAQGPVGLLMRYDYDYAMDLSSAVFSGETTLRQASKHAETWIRQYTAASLNKSSDYRVMPQPYRDC